MRALCYDLESHITNNYRYYMIATSYDALVYEKVRLEKKLEKHFVKNKVGSLSGIMILKIHSVELNKLELCLSIPGVYLLTQIRSVPDHTRRVSTYTFY